jgi:regulator of sigma D
MTKQQTEFRERRVADRRAGSHRAIREFVHARTEMLVRYGKLASHQPFAQDGEVAVLLQKFCEALIDYTASAHFQLYRYIEDNSERRRSVRKVADQNYDRILGTTKSILEFNDKYEDKSAVDKPEKLKNDLSGLGEILARRIELEDRVIRELTATR